MVFTLPNLLTLSRIAVIPLLVAACYLPYPWGNWTAWVLFALACVTDYLDGHFARRWKQMSAFGRFLDPIADKLLVAITLMMLVAFDRLSTPALMPALIILAREILVSGLREYLAGLRVSVPVSRLAKWKTGIQMVAIGVLLIGDAGPAFLPMGFIGETLLWLAALLTLVTGYDYLRHGMKHMGEPETAPAPHVPGKSVGGLG
ncbi:MAG TPA: CDP-diacylglycerol--glycerol-3-phosphate 3-phosphatidyltransferase [Aliidongia sp.]|uniref:CDP-diacylglycerol--glycerol-3-phosphate 3-phosphatidyltransferase n=1 Tax=Aliidongia sp. TaxID=1914230 RepID=UPI002DDCA601|nr:CDP-diacylglycerol--glycerol-3-phosphate 3-phosphatidyltransferase [Aliidongia sp.]HEV2677761.1 CDP-diacylglycerol--glycerol-3-phosphate 3-phosphatidyltransferase [Aliidongia sp.]